MAKKPAPRGASRSRSKPQKSKGENRLPGWLWLFTGLAAGLFIAFLVNLGEVQSTNDVLPQNQVVSTHQDSSNSSDDKDAAQVATKDLPKFDFYAVLPQKEVVLPNEDDIKPESPSTTKTTPKKTGGSATPKASASADDDNGATYLLQVGSFRDKHRADRQRAEFTLYGYSVRVQPGALSNGETWYRVMLGPFDSKARLRIAQRKLKSRKVDALAIKVKK